MGQYWYPVNLDKREFISPHKLGSGLKLWEQLANKGVGQALVVLLAAMPDARGGGDLEPGVAIGRWVGDRVAIVGDYAEAGDLEGVWRETDPPVEEIHGLCYTRYMTTTDEEWARINEEAKKFGGLFTDISDMVCEVLERHLDGIFVGDGWRTWVSSEVLRDNGIDIRDTQRVAEIRTADYKVIRQMFDKHQRMEAQRMGGTA